MADKFGANLRKLREARGIGLRKFANMIDVSPTYLSKIERDELLPPSYDVVVKIAKKLGQNQDEMLSLAGRVPQDVGEIILKRPIWAEYIRTASHSFSDEEIKQHLARLKKKKGEK